MSSSGSFNAPARADPRPYRPTSLDFINRPNPVEPLAISPKHPLHDLAPCTSSTIRHRVSLENSLGSPPALSSFGITEGADRRPPKRRPSCDAILLDLPRLPPRQQRAKRRIPPTLSGLHHPPPDAGLLPSISLDQSLSRHIRSPNTLRESGRVEDPPSTLLPSASSANVASTVSAASEHTAQVGKKLKKPNKWTEAETACLLKGVARFGIGNWTKILRCEDYFFERRTALDLKDRFRVCCPDDYGKGGRGAREASPKPVANQSQQLPSDQATTARQKGRENDRVSAKTLKEMGIRHAFAKTKRRGRTAYSRTEDEALLAGFRKYGQSWAAIRQDQTLNLGRRTATDLRDRFRQRYKEEYAAAGLALRPIDFPKKPDRGISGDGEDGSTNRGTCDGPGNASREVHTQIVPPTTVAEGRSRDAIRTSFHAMNLQPDLLYDDNHEDDFFGLALDIQGERITLDRGILDWPSDPRPSVAAACAGPLCTGPMQTSCA